MSVTEIQLFNILKSKLGESEAQSLVEYVKVQVKEEVESRKEFFLTKEDKVDIMRTIYLVGVVQFLGIVGAVLAIVNFMLK
jgi:ribosome-associated protein YbcJ (S4-like RNA binding protein)